EHADGAARWQRRVDLDGEALARERIDDVERAQTATVAEVVVDEVHRPALVRARHFDGRRRPRLARLATPSPPNGEPGGPVDAVDALPIHREALAAEDRVNATISEPRALLGDLPKASNELRIVVATRPIATRRALKTRELARTPLCVTSRLD